LWSFDVLTRDSVDWQLMDVPAVFPAPPGYGDPGFPSPLIRGSALRPSLLFDWERNEYRVQELDLTSGVRAVIAERDLPITLAASETASAPQEPREVAPGEFVRPPQRDTLGFLRALHEDPCERLWVHTHRGSSTRAVVDLFAREGELLAELHLEADVISLSGFLPGRGVIAIVRDGMGVSGLGRFELPPHLECKAP
jgi:hypothetical protein